jgi:hypothetical protein
MYSTHPNFNTPEGNVKLWRYMDFTKLLSVLENKSLFFTRADKFEDPFEGSYPKANIEARKIPPEGSSKEDKEKFLQMMQQIGKIAERVPKYTAINCWHMNSHESAAMWKLYLKSNEGIAIQTTVDRLISSIVDPLDIYIGKVNYIDYDMDGIDPNNMFNAFLHKRKSFEYENEVRAIVQKFVIEGENINWNKQSMDSGLSVEIDVNRLIENIYVAPSSPTWFGDLVTSVVVKYGYEFKVSQSNLNSKPLF